MTDFNEILGKISKFLWKIVNVAWNHDEMTDFMQNLKFSLNHDEMTDFSEVYAIS